MVASERPSAGWLSSQERSGTTRMWAAAVFRTFTTMKNEALHELPGSIPETQSDSTSPFSANSAPADAAADLTSYLDQLVASGRFCRDTRGGRIFHWRGLSVREVSRVDSLHLTVGPDRRLSTHVDRVSPLAVAKTAGRCRYSPVHVIAHNAAFLASQVGRFLSPRTNRQAGTHRRLAPRWGL
jgi:hypothetical protein